MNKIINTIWLTPGGTKKIIGIVTTENEAGERKAYIGIGDGADEAVDAKFIQEWGAKLLPSHIRTIIDDLTEPKSS